MKLTAFAAAAFLPLLLAAACRAETRAYKFTARVRDNSGVTPFEVGSTITGRFTFDDAAEDQQPQNPRFGRYASPRNTLVFYHGEQRFSGAGPVTVNTSVWDHSEGMTIVAHDLELPSGWEMEHAGRSDSFGIMLQNVPPKGAVLNDGIPDRIDLSSFVNTRELRLDFFHGVRFPGGQVDRRVIVYATVEKLEPVEVVEMIEIAPSTQNKGWPGAQPWLAALGAAAGLIGSAATALGLSRAVRGLNSAREMTEASLQALAARQPKVPILEGIDGSPGHAVQLGNRMVWIGAGLLGAGFVLQAASIYMGL